MPGLIKRFGVNPAGRDLIVGDIHGHFTKLQSALDDVGFDPEKGDRLFSVGDLVDRGPESPQALDWLQKPWFHAVQGNHEDMAINWSAGGLLEGMYQVNGGGWNINNTPEASQAIADCFALMPIAIELWTNNGLVGIVHADCPFDDWGSFIAALESEALSEMERLHIIGVAQWSRNRCMSQDDTEITGCRAVVVGHTPMQQFTSLGNVLYIDTGGWLANRDFTILDANTLRPATSCSLSLEA